MSSPDPPYDYDCNQILAEVAMGMRIGEVVTVGLLVFGLVVAAGCGNKTPGRSNLGTKIGDREVKASLDGAGFIFPKGDYAEITSAAGSIVVEPGVVRLDGEELAILPEDAKLVEVDYTAGKLTVTADGKELVNKEMPR